MNADDAELFTQSMGHHSEGMWKQIAFAERQGIPAALGYANVRDWVKERLGGYVQLPIPERQEAVAELVEQGMSNRQIGAVLGVSNFTASRDAGRNLPPSAPAMEVDLAELRVINKQKTIVYVITEALRLLAEFVDGDDAYDDQVIVMEVLNDLPDTLLAQAIEALSAIIAEREHYVR